MVSHLPNFMPMPLIVGESVEYYFVAFQCPYIKQSKGLRSILDSLPIVQE